MNSKPTSRRGFLKGGGSALGQLTVLRLIGPPGAFGQSAPEVIPWLDQPPANPIPAAIGNLLRWESLDSRIISANNFFSVNHYGIPANLDETRWRVDIAGMVDRPRSLTIADLKARDRREVEFTLECSGNSAFPFFRGGIGNGRWGGTPLAPILLSAGLADGASEVVFWGADSGEVTIRDNSGITGPGQTGRVEPDTTGGQDLTITEQFARSMSLAEALHQDNLICYELNGGPLPAANGYPVRLIAPGWYGVANVKWLNRIEVLDHRFVGKFMARDYVTIREERRDSQAVWTFTTVGPVRLKSAPAKVTRQGGRYSVMGAAWHAQIAGVEVQIDDGAWRPAVLDTPAAGRSRGYSWRFWSFDWGMPASGEHTIRSRATDIDGNLQPAATDPVIANRRTYWENNAYITRRIAIP